MTLPAVETLSDDGDTNRGPVNLAIESSTPTLDATRHDGAYHGPDAAIAGCFAAAHAVAETTDAVQFHGSSPIAIADGPWVVLAPLAGHLATVSNPTLSAELLETEVSGTADPERTTVSEPSRSKLRDTRSWPNPASTARGSAST